MKRIMFMLCLFTMMVAGECLRAQEITVTIRHGWNWISYPNAVSMEIVEAIGDFVPMEGDMLKSQFNSAIYVNGRWRGTLMQFMPGIGYMYYSNRAETTCLVFREVPIVTTSEPTVITAVCAVAGGEVTDDGGLEITARGVCWSTSHNPSLNNSHTSNGTGMGSFSSNMVGLTPSTTYYVRAYASNDQETIYGTELSFTTLESYTDHNYVNLGLPSGLLWATCNVGADVPEDYGDYFAWGEILPKDNYNWNTYQYCTGFSNTLTKYCNNPSCGYNGFSDNITVLLPEDDAATANWGGNWRMPTKEEWQELCNNTTCTWTTRNGVNGRLFTASNGNSIFLPATGYGYEGSFQYTGFTGDYWSSSLYSNNSSAWRFYFDSIHSGMSSSNRFYGKPVRAVRSSLQN